jgi:hypothetical protein
VAGHDWCDGRLGTLRAAGDDDGRNGHGLNAITAGILDNDQQVRD